MDLEKETTLRMITVEFTCSGVDTHKTTRDFQLSSDALVHPQKHVPPPTVPLCSARCPLPAPVCRYLHWDQQVCFHPIVHP